MTLRYYQRYIDPFFCVVTQAQPFKCLKKYTLIKTTCELPSNTSFFTPCSQHLLLSCSFLRLFVPVLMPTDCFIDGVT